VIPPDIFTLILHHDVQKLAPRFDERKWVLKAAKIGARLGATYLVKPGGDESEAYRVML